MQKKRKLKQSMREKKMKTRLLKKGKIKEMGEEKLNVKRKQT
jgi:hypothetical protein